MKTWSSLLLIIGLMGTACSSKKDEVQAILTGAGNDPKAFTVNGSFESGCVEHPLGGMKIVKLESEGDEAIISNDYYRGDTCEEMYNDDQLEVTLEDFGRSKVGKVVRFKIQLDGSAYTWRFYNMDVKRSSIKMSEFFMDEEDADKNPLSITLKRVGK